VSLVALAALGGALLGALGLERAVRLVGTAPAGRRFDLPTRLCAGLVLAGAEGLLAWQLPRGEVSHSPPGGSSRCSPWRSGRSRRWT